MTNHYFCGIIRLTEQGVCAPFGGGQLEGCPPLLRLSARDRGDVQPSVELVRGLVCGLYGRRI